MEIIKTVNDLKNRVAEARKTDRSVGLVPTMGALHDGHISLVERCRRENSLVVVSVFVNPTQFNNPADLATYPRTEEADAELLEKAGADIMFVPSVQEMYPEPDTRVFDLGPVADVMEGKMRPGHFNGVAQVVSKLFAMVEPDRAYFGEKDFQQIAVIRRMVELEGFNIDIVDCPICRAEDGLALSSRNVRLTARQRAIAPAIHRVLTEAVELCPEQSIAEVEKYVTNTLNSIDQLEVEYFTIVDSLTMQPISEWPEIGQPQAVGCATVYCGDVRLIDNIKFPEK